MSYKISGDIERDCIMYILNTTNSGIDKVEEVSAGSYEVTGLTIPIAHVLAVPNDDFYNSSIYRDVETISSITWPEDFGMQLKERKYHSSYQADVDCSGSLYLYSNEGGMASYGAFVSVPLDNLNGNKIYFDGRFHTNRTGTGVFGYLEVLDGKYDRNSTSDFPESLGDPVYATKGAGVLYSKSWEYDINSTSFQFTTPVLDLGSATLSDVTIFIRAIDSNDSRWFDISIDELQIKDGTTEVLKSGMTTSGTVSWPGGGNYDKGTYGGWNNFYE